MHKVYTIYTGDLSVFYAAINFYSAYSSLIHKTFLLFANHTLTTITPVNNMRHFRRKAVFITLLVAGGMGVSCSIPVVHATAL